MKLTENQEAELLRDFRQAKYQDKHTIEVLSHLYGVSVEEVKEIMANERNKAFQWTDERVHRLKAYIAQGMGNTAIANELGCNAQCVADYKRRNKTELMRFDKKKEVAKPRQANSHTFPGDIQTGEPASEQSKKKELSTVTAAESSEKLCREQPVCCSAGQTGAHIGAPLQNDYNTNAQECQEVSENALLGEEGGTRSVTGGVNRAEQSPAPTNWNERYLELSRVQGEALSRLYECEAFLTAASDAGRLWGCAADVGTGAHTGAPLRKYIEMYRVICERALECCSAAIKAVEEA